MSGSALNTLSVMLILLVGLMLTACMSRPDYPWQDQPFARYVSTDGSAAGRLTRFDHPAKLCHAPMNWPWLEQE